MKLSRKNIKNINKSNIYIVPNSSGSHTFKLESIQISDKPRSYTWTKLSASSSSSKFIMTNTCDSNLGLLAMCAEPKCEGQHPNHARRRRDGFNFISGIFFFTFYFFHLINIFFRLISCSTAYSIFFVLRM